MTYSDPARRPLVIAGLHDLAEFLEANPDLPVPYSVEVAVFVPRAADRAIRAEVDRVATLLGTEIDPVHVPYGHYDTGLTFGAVQYRLSGILAQARARHAAWSSYHGVVTPDALDMED
ncbi:MAG TPA: hypothetical protein VFU43_21230 [Streptosporangiaceae bacterium]|nr:hypothetical protein [Streptosporangiaceae bacterium]